MLYKTNHSFKWPDNKLNKSIKQICNIKVLSVYCLNKSNFGITSRLIHQKSQNKPYLNFCKFAGKALGCSFVHFSKETKNRVWWKFAQCWLIYPGVTKLAAVYFLCFKVVSVCFMCFCSLFTGKWVEVIWWNFAQSWLIYPVVRLAFCCFDFFLCFKSLPQRLRAYIFQ